jgi:hypothetical protein
MLGAVVEVLCIDEYPHALRRMFDDCHKNEKRLLKSHGLILSP